MAALVRPFEPGEWRIYRDLRLRALADSPDAFARTLAEEQAQPDAAWPARLEGGVASSGDLPLLAELDGEAVGFVWGHVDPEDATVAYVFQMWVARKARRHGLGRALMSALIDWAASRVDRLELSVTLTNESARRLYETLGFEPFGEPVPLRAGSPLREQNMRVRFPSR